jgi:RimJ/RimL family protein N-acetyltransferase
MTSPEDCRTAAEGDPPIALVPQTLAEVRASIDALSPTERSYVSETWLASLDAATKADPWVHGFAVVLPASGVRVGSAGFKGPPDSTATVEIAYGIDEAHRRRGYATAAAAALFAYACDSGVVRTVIAHTLPESNPSTRALTRCGFAYVGEVIDPEDGLVWRWERPVGAA